MDQTLIEALEEIADRYTANDDIYRAKIYNNAALTLSKVVVTSGAQAAQYKGIGKSVAVDIDQFLKNGKIERLEKLRITDSEQVFDQTLKQDVISLFQSVYGIGLVKAGKFYEKGYRTLDDLLNSSDITYAQRMGIIYKDQIDKRIPYKSMLKIQKELADRLDPYGLVWEITGSFRRHADTSGDIDLLIVSQNDLNIAGVVEIILKDLLLVNLSLGKVKYMGIMKGGHRIDILLVDKREYPTALLYFTGSKEFNVSFRERAVQLGYTLNEHSLSKNGKRVDLSSEKEIFDFLGIKYVAPKDRNGVIELIH